MAARVTFAPVARRVRLRQREISSLNGDTYANRKTTIPARLARIRLLMITP